MSAILFRHQCVNFSIGDASYFRKLTVGPADHIHIWQLSLRLSSANKRRLDNFEKKMENNNKRKKSGLLQSLGCLIIIYIYIFEVKLTFEMLTARGQQHSFSTQERVFLWKCQSFWARECLDLRGTRTPNLRIHAECSNLLSYQGQTFAAACFEHWLWWYRYFLSKVNIWNVNCARATAFIFDTRAGVLVKVSKFLSQKMSRPEGYSNPQSSDSCRML